MVSKRLMEKGKYFPFPFPSLPISPPKTCSTARFGWVEHYGMENHRIGLSQISLDRNATWSVSRTQQFIYLEHDCALYLPHFPHRRQQAIHPSHLPQICLPQSLGTLTRQLIWRLYLWKEGGSAINGDTVWLCSVLFFTVFCKYSPKYCMRILRLPSALYDAI